MVGHVYIKEYYARMSAHKYAGTVCLFSDRFGYEKEKRAQSKRKRKKQSMSHFSFDRKWK